MEIKQLDSSHRESVRDLFSTKRHMGTDGEEAYFADTATEFSQVYYDVFCDSYLSGLENYKAFGCIEAGIVTSVIAFYESVDTPAWYWTQIRSINRTNVPAILDAVLAHNERNGRLKFYSMFNLKYAKSYRKFSFSPTAAARYDFFDEFTVPERNKCFYTLPWQVLYNRTLAPIDTIVRCTFLKQVYRIELPIAGNL